MPDITQCNSLFSWNCFPRNCHGAFILIYLSFSNSFFSCSNYTNSLTYSLTHPFIYCHTCLGGRNTILELIFISREIPLNSPSKLLWNLLFTVHMEALEQLEISFFRNNQWSAVSELQGMEIWWQWQTLFFLFLTM